MENKTGFWRNFTWKKFLTNSLFWFGISLLLSIPFKYFDPSESVRELFTFKDLISRLISSALVGLLFTIWSDPMPKKKIKS